MGKEEILLRNALYMAQRSMLFLFEKVFAQYLLLLRLFMLARCLSDEQKALQIHMSSRIIYEKIPVSYLHILLCKLGYTLEEMMK